MKLRTITFALATLISTLLVAHWCIGQAGRKSVSNQPPRDDYYGLEELQSFAAFLRDTKVTNALPRFNDYSNARMVSESSAHLGQTLHALDALRRGRTNEAIQLLEFEWRHDVVRFARCYRELPESIRQKVRLTAFADAREYARRYPASAGGPETSAAIKEALGLLDQKPEH